jgi:hypothetical protein
MHIYMYLALKRDHNHLKGLLFLLLSLLIIPCASAETLNLTCRNIKRSCETADIIVDASSHHVMYTTGGCATHTSLDFVDGRSRTAADGEVVQQFVAVSDSEIKFGEKELNGPFAQYISMDMSINRHTGLFNLHNMFTLQCNLSKKRF